MSLRRRSRLRRPPTPALLLLACATVAALATVAAAAFNVVRISVPSLLARRTDICCHSKARAGVVRRQAANGGETSAEGEGETEEVDSTNVELFRQSLIQGWGGGEVGSTSTRSDWAQPVAAKELRAGDVLLAAPRGFLGGGSGGSAQRVGLRGRIPEDWPRRDQLRMLPVVLLTRVGADGGAAEGVLLNLRTGQLMGDFINHFHSRPLHYGGPDEAGLSMVHPYPQVPGAELLSEESGLYLGGDFAGAQEWVEEGQGSSLRFRFFVNRVRWPPGMLAAEAAAGGTWLPVRCSGDLVLAEAEALEDRPLWAQIAELVGGEAEEAGRRHGLLD